MSENDILSIMVKDHCKIEKLLDKLEEGVNKEYQLMKIKYSQVIKYTAEDYERMLEELDDSN